MTSPIPKLVFGGDRLVARRPRRFTDRKKQRQLFRQLDFAYEHGITAFDTARAYWDSENTLGAWLKTRRNRESICLITKIGHPGPAQLGRLTPKQMRSDLRRSLKALKTGWVDILLLHYDDPNQNVGPIMAQLNEFLTQGRARQIGASNWTVGRLAEADRYCREHDLRSFSCASAHFGLLDWNRPPWPGAQNFSPSHDRGAADYLAAAQLPLLIWSSLSFGFFAPRFDPEAKTPRTRWVNAILGSPENLRRRERALETANQQGCSLSQLVLAYALAQDFPTHCIVGCLSEEHIRDSVSALSVHLDKDTLAALRGLQ